MTRRYLLVCHKRLGDVLQCLPAAKFLRDRGHEVWIECDQPYHDIFACVDYCRPIAPFQRRGKQYDRVLTMAIHPNGGGTPERHADYRSSGKKWRQFVYDQIPEVHECTAPILFTRTGWTTPREYRLHPEAVLLAPTGYSQVVRYSIEQLEAACARLWPGRPIIHLTDALTGSRTLRARRLRDLPDIISWPQYFAAINSAPAIIAAAVRKHYVHFPQTGGAWIDDTAVPGVSEVVVP